MEYVGASGRVWCRRAQEAATRGEACILVRRETVPEDVRGMHAARAVLTERGGMTSHAAVIARGLGVPCIVGATALAHDEMAQRRLWELSEKTVDLTWP